MAKYDDASWHYGGDYPDGLPDENASTHIGMFLTWCIDHDLLSEEHLEGSEEEIDAVKNRELTGAEFLISNCDEKFTQYDLNDIGNAFAKAYYEDESNFAKKFGAYCDDYAKHFDKEAEKKGFEYESFYHVENTWENYNSLKPIIDSRFEQWEKY
ncbi:DUF7832 domain-containing protein [Flavobacterium collinsii]|uniref:DUF7832 domain-containing protein n=1 Tax=Flavobacterium collinsii TaxID=1114861 RepID=A0ABN7EH84_9FLAO|nr:hypothetical protein [Flavobacterium collinsii]CAA9195920.1 hypothetical protein FLACOL7796_00879 [Flavobacterium collinsii]